MNGKGGSEGHTVAPFDPLPLPWTRYTVTLSVKWERN